MTDLIRVTSDKFKVLNLMEGDFNFYFGGNYLDIETGEKVTFDESASNEETFLVETPDLNNIKKLQLGERDGFLLERTLPFPVGDNTIYYPLSYCLRGIKGYNSSALGDLFYGEDLFKPGNCTEENITFKEGKTPLDYNISNRGIFNIEGACSFENVNRETIESLETDLFLSSFIYRSKTSSSIPYYKYSNLGVTLFKNSPFGAEGTFTIPFKRSGDAAILYLPLEFSYPGDWCVSFYVNQYSLTLGTPRLYNKDIIGKLINTSTQNLQEGTVNTDYIEKEFLYNPTQEAPPLKNEWFRVSTIFSIEDISQRYYLYIPFDATSNSNSLSLAAFKIEKDVCPSPVALVPKIVQDTDDTRVFHNIKYPLLFNFQQFLGENDTLTKNNSWIISYKRRFDTPTLNKGRFVDSIGQYSLGIYWGYNNGNLYTNLNSEGFPTTDEELKNYFNHWERVFIYPEGDYFKVKVIPENNFATSGYTLSIKKTSITLQGTLFTIADFNLLLGGEYLGNSLKTYNGYYRDLTFTWGLEDKENFIKQSIGNRFSLYSKELPDKTKRKVTILQTETIKEGF